jgi:phosphonate transport system ATP-binding protein
MSLLRGLKMMFLPSSAQTAEVHDLLQQVGIAEKLYQRTDTLSGGQQQRVAIARALFQKPQAILADEPISSVDPARARDTIELLKTIATDGKLTLCASLHDLDSAREFFPRLIGIRRGRVVFDKPPSELTDDQFKALYDLDKSEILADQVEH